MTNDEATQHVVKAFSEHNWTPRVFRTSLDDTIPERDAVLVQSSDDTRLLFFAHPKTRIVLHRNSGEWRVGLSDAIVRQYGKHPLAFVAFIIEEGQRIVFAQASHLATSDTGYLPSSRGEDLTRFLSIDRCVVYPYATASEWQEHAWAKCLEYFREKKRLAHLMKDWQRVMTPQGEPYGY